MSPVYFDLPYLAVPRIAIRAVPAAACDGAISDAGAFFLGNNLKGEGVTPGQLIVDALLLRASDEKGG